MGRVLAHKVGAPSTCWEVMWPGKSPFPPVDITAKYSNNFRFKVPGSMARERPNLADPDKCAHERPRPLAKIRLSTWTCCPRVETDVYRVISLLGMSNAPPHCVRNRDPWLKLFSQEEQNVTFIPNQYIRGTVTGWKIVSKPRKKSIRGRMTLRPWDARSNLLSLPAMRVI